MTYQQSLHYLLEQLPMFQRVGAAAYRTDLTNIIALCKILENPHKDLKCIHVAGTNGKGSVTHIIASILQAQGYKVGVFVSPHYKDYRERIKVNGRMISKKFVTEFVSEHQKQFSNINASFFEISTAMAFAYLRYKRVDFAVIETGMGGRLDSTNIISPILSVITNISFDHQQFLGNTLEKIAKEKAGIIKSKTPVVIGETQIETRNVFIDKAEHNRSEICFADIGFEIKEHQLSTGKPFHIRRHGQREKWKSYTTDIAGSFQLKNLLTAYASVQLMKKYGVKIDEEAIAKGIKCIQTSTSFRGRWTYKPGSIPVILDSAHNEGGIRILLQELKNIRYEKLHFVYGTVSDKDIRPILSMLPKNADYYFCKANIPRGLDASELLQQAASYNLKGYAFPSSKAAYKTALRSASKKDLVLVAGSVFVTAELI